MDCDGCHILEPLELVVTNIVRALGRMDTTLIVVIIVIVVVLIGIGVAAYLVGNRRRSARLRERFGPEYERTLAATDDEREAERHLAEREKRHRSLDLRPLDDRERAAFRDRWLGVPPSRPWGGARLEEPGGRGPPPREGAGAGGAGEWDPRARAAPGDHAGRHDGGRHDGGRRDGGRHDGGRHDGAVAPDATWGRSNHHEEPTR